MHVQQWLDQNACEDDIIPGAYYDRDSFISYGTELIARPIEAEGRWIVQDEAQVRDFIESL